MVYGSTVLNLTSRLSVDLGSMAPMLTVRGVGGAVGSLIGGVFIDRLHRVSYWVLASAILSEAAGILKINSTAF